MTARTFLIAVVWVTCSTGATLATAASVTRGPYLQLLTPDSVVIRWRTDEAVRSEVAYGRDAGELDRFRSSASATRNHEVRLSGLDADTRYAYRVQEAGGELLDDTEVSEFATAPRKGEQSRTRIWVLGDPGKGGRNQRAVRDAFEEYAQDRPADMILMLGDNAYPDGSDSEYQRYMFDMYADVLRRVPVWPAFGNHDAHRADSRDESGPYFDIFTLPDAGQAGGVPSGTEAYYSFDYANIHFVVLESTRIDTSSNSPMWDWLAADLEANEQPWTIAYWHHPPYSKGSHDSDESGTQTRMRQYAGPLLEAHGVDLVMTGHSHSYERSFLLDGHYGKSETLTDRMVLDDGDGHPDGDGSYVKPAGTRVANAGAVYVVAGASGSVSDGPLDHPAMVYSFPSLGSLVIDVDGPRLTAGYLDDGGVFMDRFSIVKVEGGGDGADSAPNDEDEGGDTVTVSFEDGVSPTAGYRGTRDTVISQYERRRNFGRDDELSVDGDDPSGTGRDRSILLKWKIDGIPSDAVVEEVSITVDVTNRSNSRYYLMRLRRYWIEGEASWESRRHGRDWSSGGADASRDRDSEPLAIFTASKKGRRTIQLNPAGVALVQRWVSGDAPNDGFIIARSSQGDGLDFRSREAKPDTGRPRLTITYTVP